MLLCLRLLSGLLVLVKAKLKMIAVGLLGFFFFFPSSRHSYTRTHKSALRGGYVMTPCALSAAGKTEQSEMGGEENRRKRTRRGISPKIK